MQHTLRVVPALLAAVLALSAQTRMVKPTDYPNPYRLVEWPTLPKTMNGGRWGEVIREVGIRIDQ